MELDRFTGGSSLDDALKKVNNEILDGVKYGFFDFTIRCELINGRKRRLTICAGKHHRYIIPEEALPD